MLLTEKPPTEGFYMTLHCTGCQIMCYVTWLCEPSAKKKVLQEFWRNSLVPFNGFKNSSLWSIKKKKQNVDLLPSSPLKQFMICRCRGTNSSANFRLTTVFPSFQSQANRLKTRTLVMTFALRFSELFWHTWIFFPIEFTAPTGVWSQKYLAFIV